MFFFCNFPQIGIKYLNKRQHLVNFKIIYIFIYWQPHLTPKSTYKQNVFFTFWKIDSRKPTENEP